jgi:hypothetical protein
MAKSKHGHYVGNKPSPEYYTWRSIKARCLNPKHHNYDVYGGAGIILDEVWASNFEIFLRDIGLRPSRHHTLDRIKNDLGYVPGNVRWATRHIQNRNRSDNHWITFNNETLCLKDWANKLGCTPNAIRTRVLRGWSWEAAVSTLPNPKLQTKKKIYNQLETIDKDIKVHITQQAIKLYNGGQLIRSITKHELNNDKSLSNSISNIIDIIRVLESNTIATPI